MHTVPFSSPQGGMHLVLFKIASPNPKSKTRPHTPRSMRPATFIPSEYRVPSPNTGIDLSQNRPLLYPSTSFDFSESGCEWDQPLLRSRSSHPSRPSVYP